jgi:hypothetical protein
MGDARSMHGGGEKFINNFDRNTRIFSEFDTEKYKVGVLFSAMSTCVRVYHSNG